MVLRCQSWHGGAIAFGFNVDIQLEEGSLLRQIWPSARNHEVSNAGLLNRLQAFMSSAQGMRLSMNREENAL